VAPGGGRGERGDRLARRGGALTRARGLTGSLTPDEVAAVARARGYPWRFAEPEPAPADALDAALHDGFVGVVAYGSNASPDVLRLKLGDRVASAVLARPVTLADTDVVYSAHVSLHGAIPATLAHAPGTEIDARLLAVPGYAIAALDATEPNYVRAPHPPAQAYLSRHGELRIDGAPVAVAAVPARGRTLPALTEAELLEQVRTRLAPNQSPDRFVLAHLTDDRVRLARSAALRDGL
jgi:hypothetical protein